MGQVLLSSNFIKFWYMCLLFSSKYTFCCGKINLNFFYVRCTQILINSVKINVNVCDDERVNSWFTLVFRKRKAFIYIKNN